MSLNLQSQYYSTTRDFAMIENDAADIAAIEATFNSDYAAGTPLHRHLRRHRLQLPPGPGDHLIWSPTTAQAAMVSLIDNANKTLLVENEEMGASAHVVSALETACKRGVTVQIAMVDNTSYATSSSR